MQFYRNTKCWIKIRVYCYVDPSTGAEKQVHEVNEYLEERPGNRVPMLLPRKLDVPQRVIQPCRSKARMNRKGRK